MGASVLVLFDKLLVLVFSCNFGHAHYRINANSLSSMRMFFEALS